METTKKILLLVLTVCMNFATVSGRTAATGGSEGETAEAAADSTLYLSNDTIVKPSGDTTVKHLYVTRLKKSGDTVVRKNNFFRRFYRYFETANEDKTQTKKLDFSIIGGPHYSSDIKLGIGIVAAGLYRVDKKDLSIQPSSVSLFGDITTTGFYLLGVSNNTLLKGGKYRVGFSTYFFSFPSAFWGIGYDNATYATPGSYKRLQNQVKADFMFRVAKNFYLGVDASFNYIEGKDFSDVGYLRGEATRYINTGVGGYLMYAGFYSQSVARGLCEAGTAGFPRFLREQRGVFAYRTPGGRLSSGVERGRYGLRPVRGVQLRQYAVDDARPDGGIDPDARILRRPLPG